MRLCLHNRSSQANILKTDEEDQVFNVAENKTNSIADILFQIEVLLRFGATAIVLPGNFFLKISLKHFPKHSVRLF